jgi:peptide deformylase
MSIREIIHLPDPLLREISKPVERIDDDLLRLLDDMAETMYDAPGIGLAGIQVGVPLRIVTVDVAEREAAESRAADEEQPQGQPDELPAGDPVVTGRKVERKPLFLINPRIIERSDETSVHEEGCLSIPEYYAEVERPARCRVAFLDRSGSEQFVEASGILATCLQHEIDHLEGKLFIDHLSRLKRDMVIKKFTKQSRLTGKGSQKSMTG